MEATKSLFTGPDKELVEALKKQAKKDSINRTPEQQEAIRKQQEEYARVAELREDAIRQMRLDGNETAKYYANEKEPEDGFELSYNMGLVLAGALFAGFLFLIWWFVIRKIRNNIRDFSYLKNDAKEKFNQTMNDPCFSAMSNEERESFQKAKKFFDGNV